MILSKIILKSSLIKEIGPIEFFRLKRLKKFEPTYTYFRGCKLQVVDASTYLSLINEIFIDEIYKFNAKSGSPIIFDCGANIGLATIYFKMRFPNAKVFSFEPDPKIYDSLKFNISSYKFHDVNLCNEAISNEEGYCEFVSEGSLSGMINVDSTANLIKVKTARLKNMLDQFPKIDFLKIDIEGHEEYVIEDIKNELYKVDNMFLEYHSFINKPQTLDKILNIITNAGFRYYFKESDFKRNPFVDRILFHNIDTVVNIFCYK